MKSSEQTAGEKLFQLPFNGLGISLKTCAEVAGKMVAVYATAAVTTNPVPVITTEHVFTGFSGYELLLALGREIRGR
ncbi:hypothetical protein [Maridesulfovibrio sp.]|uniref:hypothetical protein n=1 Tax=Maridesulfovibrio sp. TaxID=2795000 RepID=UPI002A18C388|nr:hypothetical protein [Maridesulfovibrio sp.]